MKCCDDWEEGTRKINGPLILAQARNPSLTGTPEFQFKPWIFCPWCGRERAEFDKAVAATETQKDSE